MIDNFSVIVSIYLNNNLCEQPLLVEPRPPRIRTGRPAGPSASVCSPFMRGTSHNLKLGITQFEIRIN